MAMVSFRDSRPGTLSERARKVFQLANQEAQRLNHSAIGTEHLLIGLAKESLSDAARLLREHGFDLRWLRSRLEAVYPPGKGQAILPGSLGYTLQLRAFVEDVVEAAKTAGVLPLTPEYLLSALLEAPGELVCEILEPRKQPVAQLRRALRGVT